MKVPHLLYSTQPRKRHLSDSSHKKTYEAAHSGNFGEYMSRGLELQNVELDDEDADESDEEDKLEIEAADL